MNFLAILLLIAAITSIEIIFKAKKLWQSILKASIVVLLVCIMSFLSYKAAEKQHLEILNNLKRNMKAALKSTEIMLFKEIKKTNTKDENGKSDEIPMDYFFVSKLSESPAKDCFLPFEYSAFPNINFQLGNAYFLTKEYEAAIDKYKLAIDEIESLSSSKLKELIKGKFTGKELKNSILNVLTGTKTSNYTSKKNENDKKIKQLVNKIKDEDSTCLLDLIKEEFANQDLIEIKDAYNLSLSSEEVKNLRKYILEKLSDPKEFTWAIHCNLSITYDLMEDQKKAKKAALESIKVHYCDKTKNLLEKYGYKDIKTSPIK